jgi:hypothetical protein
MQTLKCNNEIIKCIPAQDKKYTLSNDLEKISKEYGIGLIYLKKLCDDICNKTIFSYFESICIISDELSLGLDINKIILKYNLDKELI